MHPLGQILVVTDGIGRVQAKGGPLHEIRMGDAVVTPAGEWHWHGGGPANFMTHLAIQQAAAEGGEVQWGEHVTDEEYQAPPG